MPSLTAVRKALAMKPANSPVSAALPAGDTEAAERLGHVRAADGAQACRLAVEVLRERALAAQGGTELGDVLRPHAGQPVQSLRAVRRHPGDRRRRQAPPGQQGGAGKRVRPSSARRQPQQGQARGRSSREAFPVPCGTPKPPARIIEVLTPGGSERWFEKTAALQPGDTEGFRASCQRHGIEFFPDSPWLQKLQERYRL